MPHGKHALILVKQPKGNLVWISTQETAASNKMAPPPASAVDKDKKFEPRLKTWNDCDYIQVIKSAFKCTLLCSPSAPRQCHPHSHPHPASSIHILLLLAPQLRGHVRVALPSKFNERYGIKIISSARPMAGKQDTHTYTPRERTKLDKWEVSCIPGELGKLRKKRRQN